MTGEACADECEILRRLRRAAPLFDRLQEDSASELRIQNELRRDFPAELVRAALTLCDLRRKASAKFSRAGQMWFDRNGLEQATSEAVALHKARRFDGLVWDYCCGIGSDATALAGRGPVIAVDRNPAACLRAQWNGDAYGVASNVQVICADVETLASREGLVHIDPDRRAHGRGRSLRVEESVPGLQFLTQLTREFSGGAIKLSPAGNFSTKFLQAEFELVSLAGECKEATVWFGRLAAAGTWRATVLPSGASLAGDPLECRAAVGRLERFVYDPDPAVVRAGLIDLLAERNELKRLDAEEEFLTADRAVMSPFVHPFEVVADLPNNEREIRRYFRRSDLGQVEIKCRRIPIDVEAVRRKLPLPGNQPGVLIFVRISGKARALICRRLHAGSGKNSAPPLKTEIQPE